MENQKKQDAFFLRGKKQLNGNKFNNKVKPQETQEKSNDFYEESQNSEHYFKGKRQQNFDQNRTARQDTSDDKKPFDKKTYRLKKYSKKYKLEQWEEQRKKRLLRNLQRDLKSDEGAGTYKPKTFDQDATDGQDVTDRFVKHPDLIEKENAEKAKLQQRKRPILSARERHEKMKQEKLEKQQQVQMAIEEKRQKIQEYKKKKQEKFKKLSKKTKKGQPVMTGRLELLLEKIQKNK